MSDISNAAERTTINITGYSQRWGLHFRICTGNHNAQFKKSYTYCKSFYLKSCAWNEHELPCSTVSKRLYIPTVLSNILFALETTRSLDLAQETFQLSKSTLGLTQWLPLGRKQYLFLMKAFDIYTCDDETACVLHSQCWPICQETIIVKTLSQQACDWKCDRSQMSVKIWVILFPPSKRKYP